MKFNKRAAGLKDTDAMNEWLAKGGQVTHCAPGPSETVVYKNSYRKRAKPPAGEAASAEPSKPDEPKAS